MKPIALSLVSLAVSFLALPSLAQERPPEKPVETQKAETAKEAKEAKEAKPDQESAALTVEERIKILRMSLSNLLKEKEYLTQIADAGGLTARFRERLMDRSELGSFQEVEMGPKMSAGKVARLLGDAEKKGLAEDVVFTADSLPVAKTEYEGLRDYLLGYPSPENPNQRTASAILSLIEAKACQAAFPAEASQALASLKKLQAELKAGGSFADLAIKHSDDKASAARGGDLEYIPREAAGADKQFAMTAFTLGIGEVSDIVQTRYGYHLVRVTAKKKGSTPDQDLVRVSHILKTYSKDLSKLQSIQKKVEQGVVDVAFREDSLRKLAPKQFK